MPLAGFMSGKYKAPYGMSQEDWFSEVAGCLVVAVAYYSPARGTSLSSIFDKLVFNHRSCINSKRRAIRHGANVKINSMDETLGEVGCNRALSIGGIDPGFERVDLIDFCNVIISKFDGRYRDVLTGVMSGISINDVGDACGYSRQYVNQILTSIRRRLIDQYPDEVRASGSCLDCGGPMVQMSTMSTPKRCTKCAHTLEKKTKAKWARENPRKKPVGKKSRKVGA